VRIVKGVTVCVGILILLFAIIKIDDYFFSCFADDGSIAKEYDIPLDHLEQIKRRHVANTFQSGCRVIFDDSNIRVICKRPAKKIKYETVKMGRYIQNKTEEEPIEWLIIDSEGDKTLLLSKYSLDAKQYDEKLEDISWEQSLLREWLNNDFYHSAFNAQEQEEIRKCDLISDFYTFCGWEGKRLPSSITKDRLFVLDSHERMIYLVFAGNDYNAEPTAYARQHTSISLSDHAYSQDRTTDWSRFGAVPNISCQVCWSFGLPYEYHYCEIDYVEADEKYTDTLLYVRPAMWVSSDYINKLKDMD